MQLEEFLRWREITERSEVEKTASSSEMGSNKLSTRITSFPFDWFLTIGNGWSAPPLQHGLGEMKDSRSAQGNKKHRDRGKYRDGREQAEAETDRGIDRDKGRHRGRDRHREG